LSVEATGRHLVRPTAIDPRIRARRISVQRGVGRRRLQRLVDVGLVLAVAAGFLLALRTPLLDVDDVVVGGNEHTSAEAVVAAAGIQRGDQLVDLDLRAAGEAVAALPWVREATLHRGIDGRIDVQVEERTPVAVLGVGEAARLVDAEGRVLGPAFGEPAAASLVTIEGIGDGAEPGSFLGPDAADALAVAANLGGALDLGLRLVVEDGNLAGVVDPGIEVRFGDASQLEAKVRSLRTVLDQVDLTCAGRIDLRSPGSPVLTREEGCS
jgi:cell division protein FtsQ